jgi:hypothetical protein
VTALRHGALVNSNRGVHVGSNFDVGRPWVCQVGGADLWVWLRMRAMRNIDHEWA